LEVLLGPELRSAAMGPPGRLQQAATLDLAMLSPLLPGSIDRVQVVLPRLPEPGDQFAGSVTYVEIDPERRPVYVAEREPDRLRFVLCTPVRELASNQDLLFMPASELRSARISVRASPVSISRVVG